MYPNIVFLGMTLYEILILLGFFCALVSYRILADRQKFPAGVQNLCLAGGGVGLIGGYGASVLVQAVYNGLESGKFEITSSTGATFYGGLVGGAACYLLLYFVGGRFILGKGVPQTYFWRMSGIAAGSIAIAHSLGRIGCLTAGCCHGAVTTAWYGIWNQYLHAKTVPVQLFEAGFLLLLFVFLTYRNLKGKRYNLAIYLISYAVWRFCIEYLRGDDRGKGFISFLSPSQFTAILLLALGVGLILLERYCARRTVLEAPDEATNA